MNVYLCTKAFSSENVVVTVDTCKENTSKITFYKTFCIRTLTLVILYIYMKNRLFLVSRKVKTFLHFFKCMSIIIM